MTALMILVGMVLPALIGTLTRSEDSSRKRFWVSFILCSVFGALVWLLNSNGVFSSNWSDTANAIASSIAMMTGLVKLSYEGFWDNKAVSKFVPDTVLDNESPLKALGLKPAK